MSDVLVVYDEGGDWVALYNEGLLVDEGHSLSVRQILEALNIPFREATLDLSDGTPLPREETKL